MHTSTVSTAATNQAVQRGAHQLLASYVLSLQHRHHLHSMGGHFPIHTDQSPDPTPGKLPRKFDGRSDEYRAWKDIRLQRPDGTAPPVAIPIKPTIDQHHSSLTQLCQRVRDFGFSTYQWTTPADSADVKHIARHVEQLHQLLTLTKPDKGVVSDSGSLSLLKNMRGTSQGRFIPYTDRAMGWHTDGYYNDLKHTLRCFTLHCVSPAASGGELSLIDHELLFITLYEESPDLITLLSHPQAMTLPANKDDLGHDRPDRHAPVFFCHSDATIGARFTTRTKNIRWRNDDTQAAAERAAEVLAENPDWHHTIRLERGQGIITRNILHRREAFADEPGAPARQMLRGRYLQLPSIQ